MTILTIPQIYSTWIGVDGATGAQAIYATAIALAESGGDDHAVSPSDDHGVWQINGLWASTFPRLWPARYDAHANARMAKSISGNGINWGPWCTAYEDQRLCGRLRLAAPQTNSAAGRLVSHVASVIGSHDPGTAGTANLDPGPARHPGAEQWQRIRHIAGRGGSGWDDSLQHSLAYLRKVGR